MRPGPNAKRGRGRGNGRKPPPRNQSVDSSGPSVRIRGNTYQVLEKYLALARDATASGDRISAENYFQHAEHYFRVVNAANGGQNQNRQRQVPSPAERPPAPISAQPSSQVQPQRQPATEQPAAERPATEQSAAERPAAEQPTAEQPGAEQPEAEQPEAEQPASEPPIVAQTVVEQPNGEEPAAGPQTAQPRPKAETSRTNGSGGREGQNGADESEAEAPDSDQPIV